MLNEIKRKCCDGNFVCPHDKICDGHKFIDYIELLFSSIAFAVEEKKFFTDIVILKTLNIKKMVKF